MSRPTSTQETTMALQVEIEFGRVWDVLVYNGTGWTIAAPITIPLVLREESNVVAFTNNAVRAAIR